MRLQTLPPQACRGQSGGVYHTPGAKRQQHGKLQPPTPAGPQWGAKILGRVLCWLRPQPLGAGRLGLESLWGELGQINWLHLNLFTWKMEMTVSTLKEEVCPQGHMEHLAQ